MRNTGDSGAERNQVSYLFISSTNSKGYVREVKDGVGVVGREGAGPRVGSLLHADPRFLHLLRIFGFRSGFSESRMENPSAKFKTNIAASATKVR